MHRPRQHSADDPVACFVTAMHTRKWRAWLEAGPRLFEATTDRFLGQIECGDIGRIAYPAWGLDDGVLGVVVGWREALAARRLTITFATLPEA